MCGITGVLKKDRSDIDQAVLSSMTHALSHRGPDGYGTKIINNIGLGHRRLSIIDLETGTQPMSNKDGTVWITFNGEIYNYRELRRQFEIEGNRFRTLSDTEVIIFAYEKWGEDCVKHFRGMFAFAIADVRRKIIFMARDHFGIKPLFYLNTPKIFALASEIQALKMVEEVPEVQFSIDLHALDKYLWLQYIPAPMSIFKGVKKLPPACHMKISFDGDATEPVVYWQPTFNPDETRTEADWLEEWDTVIRDSVKTHLVADVPFGAFLSGGIDSAAITAYMAQVLEQPIKTFSVGFEDPEINELPYAKTVSERWKTEHFEKVVTPDAFDILPDLVRHYGEPFGDSSSVPTYYVAKYAKEHVPMVLSGDGGDEFFAGYQSYTKWMDSIHDNNSNTSLENWLSFIHYMPGGLRRNLWKPEFRHHTFLPLEEFEKEFEKTRLLSTCHIVQYMDIKTYLPYDILTKVDIAAMMHGLEVRTPLIDVQVAELALRIPGQFNMNKDNRGQWTGKLLPKKVLRRYYPEAFLNRPKQGFRCPLKKWFKQPGQLEELLQEALFSPRAHVRNFFEGAVLERIAKSNNTSSQWLLLFLEEWLSQNQNSSIEPKALNKLEIQIFEQPSNFTSSQNFSATDIYHAASVFKVAGETGKAETLFNMVLEKGSGNDLIGGAYFHLAEICLAQQQSKIALGYFEKCLTFIPGHRKAAVYIQNIKSNDFQVLLDI